MLNAGLRDNARLTPDQPVIVHGALRLSYAQLEAAANQLSHLLRERGLARGDHIACLLPNGAAVFAVVWAAYRCGLYVTPIATTLAPPEAAYIVTNCQAKLVLSDVSCAALAQALPALCAGPAHWLSLGRAMQGFEDAELLLANCPTTPIADEVPGALMLYTSGTTGAPKAVCRPLVPPDYQDMPPFARDLLELFQLGGSAVRYLLTAPLYHAAPLRTSLAVTAGGGTVYVMDRFDAEAALTLLETEGITHSQWVPAMFQRLLALPEARRRAHRAPAHRLAYLGAAPCSPKVKQAMIAWWGPILLEYYAGTEGVGSTTISAEESLAKPGSVGRAKRGEIHILDPEDGELPVGQIGRIFFSGVPHFAYFNDPEKTRTRTSSQGYQTLGDVGYVDADGYLYLTDRADDMIISGGVNVYPQEIEAAIMEVEGVADCGVVGVADERFGETPVAFVVATPEAARQPEALLAAIAAANRTRLGKIKQPARVILCTELPRSPTGKLLRRQLRTIVPQAEP